MATVRTQNVDLWTALLADLDPYQRSRVLKRIDARNPPSFYTFAKDCFLEKATRQTGAEALLVETGLLVRAVCNTNVLTRTEAIELARMASEVDPAFDAKLLRYLSAPPRIWPEEVSEEEALHVLAVVSEFSDGTRLVAPLIKFLALPYKRVRSKATKLIARGTRNPGWIEFRKYESDARVRANLMDGLLQQGTPLSADMMAALQEFAQDANHRVASTCLLLLARGGNVKAKQDLKEMLQHPSPSFQAAARWALNVLGVSAGAEQGDTPTEAALQEA